MLWAHEPGGLVRYTLEVINHGPDASAATVVTDTLPAALEYVSDTGGCDTSALPAVTCPLGSLAVGETVEFELVTRLRAGTRGTFVNSAQVAGANVDPNGANNPSAAPTQVAGPARLALSKRAGTSVARPGGVVSYKITVRNRGGSAASKVRVCDRLPAYQTRVRAPKADVRKRRLVCWRIKQLPAGGKRAFSILTRVALASPVGSQRNRATATAANVNGRRTDTARVRIGPAPPTCLLAHTQPTPSMHIYC